jgi:enterobactin synthetase component D / holo-[acyl-carrier protein] synthase
MPMEPKLNLPEWVFASGLQFNRSSIIEDSLHKLPLVLEHASTKRKREFVAGRKAARQALYEAGCRDPGPLGIGPDRLPVWPEKWKGSISHTDGIAVAAVSRNTSCYALGIDIECMIRSEVVQKIHREVVYTGELELLRDYDLTARMTLIFSAKESLYKALYPHTRRFLSFRSARLTEVTKEHLLLQLTEEWGKDWQKGSTVVVHYGINENHACTAVCMPSPCTRAR